MKRRGSFVPPIGLLIAGFLCVDLFLHSILVTWLAETDRSLNGDAGSLGRSSLQTNGEKSPSLRKNTEYTGHPSEDASGAKTEKDTRQGETPSPRRFPRYGTREFSDQCRWTRRESTHSDCKVLVRPRSRENEGLARWITNIVAAHMVVQQLGCGLLFDYGPGVNLSAILVPNEALPQSDADDFPMNWTVPTGFKCGPADNCSAPIITCRIKSYEGLLGFENVIEPPDYRSIFSLNRDSYDWYQSIYPSLRRQMKIDFETGMACSLGSLIRLAPSAEQFEPLLFTTLLPTLRSPSSFVIVLYIRTHQAEPQNSRVTTKEEAAKQAGAKATVECAIQVEQQMSPNSANVVWMVATDSPLLKSWVQESYSTSERKVLTTSSRGRHTRTGASPDTRDFAEAMIDWILMGESDVVVANEWWSFGSTAALRTARPYFSFYASGNFYRKATKQCVQIPLTVG